MRHLRNSIVFIAGGVAVGALALFGTHIVLNQGTLPAYWYVGTPVLLAFGILLALWAPNPDDEGRAIGVKVKLGTTEHTVTGSVERAINRLVIRDNGKKIATKQIRYFGPTELTGYIGKETPVKVTLTTDTTALAAVIKRVNLSLSIDKSQHRKQIAINWKRAAYMMPLSLLVVLLGVAGYSVLLSDYTEKSKKHTDEFISAIVNNLDVDTLTESHRISYTDSSDSVVTTTNTRFTGHGSPFSYGSFAMSAHGDIDEVGSYDVQMMSDWQRDDDSVLYKFSKSTLEVNRQQSDGFHKKFEFSDMYGKWAEVSNLTDVSIEDKEAYLGQLMNVGPLSYQHFVIGTFSDDMKRKLARQLGDEATSPYDILAAEVGMHEGRIALVYQVHVSREKLRVVQKDALAALGYTTQAIDQLLQFAPQTDYDLSVVVGNASTRPVIVGYSAYSEDWPRGASIPVNIKTNAPVEDQPKATKQLSTKQFVDVYVSQLGERLRGTTSTSMYW